MPSSKFSFDAWKFNKSGLTTQCVQSGVIELLSHDTSRQPAALSVGQSTLTLNRDFPIGYREFNRTIQ